VGGLRRRSIRFIKPYHLEDLRLLQYDRLRNLVPSVLAAVHFSAAWLRQALKLVIMATRVSEVAQRFFGVPDFHCYALADGISTLFSKLAHWVPRIPHPHDPPGFLQSSPPSLL